MTRSTAQYTTHLRVVFAAIAVLCAAILFITDQAGAQDTPTIAPVVTTVDAADAAEDDGDVVTMVTTAADTDTAEPVANFAVAVDVDADNEAFADLEEIFAPFDDCMDAELGDIEEADITDEALDAAFTACDPLIPAEFAEWDEQFEDFEACMADQDLDEFFEDMDAEWDEHGWDEDVWNEDAWPATITLFDGDDLQVATFGEADGSVSITQVDGELVVTSTGDITVETLSVDDLDAEFAAFEAAAAACDPLLPDEHDFGFAFDEELVEEGTG